MSERYTVSENQFGYEVNGSMLRYCVIDNAPDKVSAYSPSDRAHHLYDIAPGSKPFRPMRQIAFCAHREDAENLASALNLTQYPVQS